jgi:triphosphoribosyl-dephospho-CoA synthase
MTLKTELCEYISKCAVQSMLYEVTATPKPGLVDRANSGAHKDMDFFSFMSSSAVLGPFFYRCARKGVEYDSPNVEGLFHQIRGLGVEAEHKMFQATGGVNTHKGLIFSLGIICAAAGYYFLNKTEFQVSIEKICHIVSQMTKGITQRELVNICRAQG